MKKIILFFLSFLLTLSLAGCDLFTSYNQIAADTLLNSYINNPKLANQKYTDKNLEVTGTISDIYQLSHSNCFYVVISQKFQNKRLYRVVAEYPADEINKVSELKKGDMVSVKGLCVGKTPQKSPIMTNIEIKVGKKKSIFSNSISDLFEKLMFNSEKNSTKETQIPKEDMPNSDDLNKAQKEQMPLSMPKEPSPYGKYGPAKSDVRMDAETPEGLFVYFHEQITAHNLREAYRCFSPDFRNQVEFNGWASGYDNTLKSEPTITSQPSITGSTAQIHFDLRATDRDGYSTLKQTFRGTATLYRINGEWKIDEIIARKIS